MQKTNSDIQNNTASIKNLDMQVGQLNNLLYEHIAGTL